CPQEDQPGGEQGDDGVGSEVGSHPASLGPRPNRRIAESAPQLRTGRSHTRCAPSAVMRVEAARAGSDSNATPAVSTGTPAAVTWFSPAGSTATGLRWR